MIFKSFHFDFPRFETKNQLQKRLAANHFRQVRFCGHRKALRYYGIWIDEWIDLRMRKEVAFDAF